MTCEFLISSSTLLVNFGIVQYLEMLLVKYFGEGLLHSNWNLFFRLAEEVPVNCVHFSYLCFLIVPSIPVPQNISFNISLNFLLLLASFFWEVNLPDRVFNRMVSHLC